jgi:hypothetical protein
MTDILSSKSSKKFECKICHFKCSRKSQYVRHLNTLKHKNTSLGLTNTNNLVQESSKYKCDCGNSYKHRQSLYHHKKKCSFNVANEDNNYSNSSTDILDKDLLIKMVLKNTDVIEKLIEIMPQIGNTTNNMNNCMNKTFNINMFLNEHCKNAMNLSDFIESLPITDKIHENTIKNGLTSTITNMMVDGLNELDILDRPIHCTDTKRKTMYVKENDVWEKDKELIKILYGIKKTALKNRMNLDKWQDANDGWMVKENIQMKYLSLVSNVMTFIEDEDKHVNKIINAIGKKVYLDEDTKKDYI